MALLQQQVPVGDPSAIPADPNAQPGAVPGAPVDPATQAAGPEGFSEEVSPEEQDSYDKVVLAGQKALFEDDKTSKEAEEFLKAGAKDPAQAIADYTHLLITGLDESMGNNIPDTVVIPAATELMENISDMADSIGAFPVDNNLMNRAMQLFLPDIAETYGVEDADLQAFMESIDPATAEAAMLEGEAFAASGQQPPGGQPLPPGVI